MFAVIFEVVPKPERKDEYLELGKLLRPEIEKIDGFMDNERFASQRSQGRVLSLSTWRDEKAVIRWRTLAVHHKVQEKGRFEVFQDYHLRSRRIHRRQSAANGTEAAATATRRDRGGKRQVRHYHRATRCRREAGDRGSGPRARRAVGRHPGAAGL